MAKQILTHKTTALTYTVNFTPYENRNLKGFVSVVVKENESGKVAFAFNEMQLVIGKDGNLFLASPKKYPKNEDGTLDYTKGFPYFIIDYGTSKLTIDLIKRDGKFAQDAV